AVAKITTEEISLAQALAELSVKPKVVVQEPVQSTTTTTPSTIPKAKSITFRDPGESTTRPTLTPIPSDIKDKGKAKMIKPKKPLKMLLAERLQAREQEELTNKENARLFVELLEERKKHFVALRAQEKRNKPPTKLFDEAMTRVNMFVDMDTELVKESLKKAEVEMIHRKGRNGYYEIIRADRSAKTYLLFSQLLKEFDREDLENLWKLVKAKHGNTRPEEGYKRVL
ncbi:hypothetical protein Tco_1536393, partial [Tanacetum coccineum]